MSLYCCVSARRSSSLCNCRCSKSVVGLVCVFSGMELFGDAGDIVRCSSPLVIAKGAGAGASRPVVSRAFSDQSAQAAANKQTATPPIRILPVLFMPRNRGQCAKAFIPLNLAVVHAALFLSFCTGQDEADFGRDARSLIQLASRSLLDARFLSITAPPRLRNQLPKQTLTFRRFRRPSPSFLSSRIASLPTQPGD